MLIEAQINFLNCSVLSELHSEKTEMNSVQARLT